MEENRVVILLNFLSSEFDFKCKAIFEGIAGPYNTGLKLIWCFPLESTHSLPQPVRHSLFNQER